VWNDLNPTNPVKLQQVAGMLQQLAASRLIELYEVDGKKIVQLLEWHERIRTGVKPKWPAKPELQQVAASCSKLLPSSSSSSSSSSSTPSSSGGESNFGIDQARGWFNSLFGYQKTWSYEEDRLLSTLIPISKEERALISWAYKILPRDREGWALYQGYRLSRPKQSLLPLLEEFRNEVQKWHSVKANLNGANNHAEMPTREVLPTRWVSAMRKLYGEDAKIPSEKKFLPPSVVAEIEQELKHEQA